MYGSKIIVANVELSEIKRKGVVRNEKALIRLEPRDKGILGEAFTESEIQEAFHSFDLNKDGHITTKEIKAILRKMGETATEDELDEMISMFDTTGKGKITYHDFFSKIAGHVVLLAVE